MTQKLLACAAGLASVRPNMLVEAEISLVMGNDITAPLAIEEFERCGGEVFDKNKICIVLDHFTPCKDIKSASQCAVCRSFAEKYGLPLLFDCGSAGIEHVLLPERGMVTAGDVVIGADSHTCTYGALGAFSTGVGSTDMAFAMLTGKAWFKVPEAIKIELCGELRGAACGKDVILTLIGMLGVDGARYKSLEFCGDLHSLSVSDRLCISNMAIEAGAKNGIFEVDELTLGYLEYTGAKAPRIYRADPDAQYSRTIKLELSEIVPVVAFPSLPSNVRRFGEFEKIKINQAVIGSCTNGRLDDLYKAAEILKGRHIADGVRCIVIPATQKIYLEALEAGLISIFIKAGCVVSTPTCGPCLGGHMGVLAKGERCIATTNRNFVGRMGHPEAEVYLASPATAAQSALCGYIAEPRG